LSPHAVAVETEQPEPRGKVVTNQPIVDLATPAYFATMTGTVVVYVIYRKKFLSKFPAAGTFSSEPVEYQLPLLLSPPNYISLSSV
jgi:hypothetical protein